MIRKLKDAVLNGDWLSRGLRVEFVPLPYIRAALLGINILSKIDDRLARGKLIQHATKRNRGIHKY